MNEPGRRPPGRTWADALEGIAVPAPLIEVLRSAATRVRRAPGGTDVASGTRIGHPLHPALITGPLGAWTGAAVLDLTGRSPRAARQLVGAGLLMAAPTALTGLGDWLDTSGPEQRVGALHAVANLTAVAAYAASWALRGRRPRAGVALGMIGAGVATGAGWLGGHLVYSMGVGVDTNAFSSGPSEWRHLDVRPEEGELARAEADGVSLCVSAVGGAPAVLADRCSHRGGPLSGGAVDGGCVTCPWHGSRFDLRSGAVRRGPATAPQPSYEARAVGNGVQVRRDERRSLRANPV